jgi:hypothetical protein
MSESRQLPLSIPAVSPEFLEIMNRFVMQYDLITKILTELTIVNKHVGGLSPKRQGPSKKTKANLEQIVLLDYHGWCPCCRRVEIMVNGHRLPSGVVDHWTDNHARNHERDLWLICTKCHDKFTRGVWTRDEKRSLFDAFQIHRRTAQGDFGFGHH